VSALRNREVVLRFFEAYNQRDEDVLRDCLAEGLVTVAILAGATLGGGSTINWQNCVRPPDAVRQRQIRPSPPRQC
jgi:ketosteroid isomerase-like protein